MGHKDIEERKKTFAAYQINDETLSWAKPDIIFMQCLPSYRSEEMTDSFIEGPRAQSSTRARTGCSPRRPS